MIYMIISHYRKHIKQKEHFNPVLSYEHVECRLEKAEPFMINEECCDSIIQFYLRKLYDTSTFQIGALR